MFSPERRDTVRPPSRPVKISYKPGQDRASGLVEARLLGRDQHRHVHLVGAWWWSDAWPGQTAQPTFAITHPGTGQQGPDRDEAASAYGAHSQAFVGLRGRARALCLFAGECREDLSIGQDVARADDQRTAFFKIAKNYIVSMSYNLQPWSGQAPFGNTVRLALERRGAVAGEAASLRRTHDGSRIERRRGFTRPARPRRRPKGSSVSRSR